MRCRGVGSTLGNSTWGWKLPGHFHVGWEAPWEFPRGAGSSLGISVGTPSAVGVLMRDGKHRGHFHVGGGMYRRHFHVEQEGPSAFPHGEGSSGGGGKHLGHFHVGGGMRRRHFHVEQEGPSESPRWEGSFIMVSTWNGKRLMHFQMEGGKIDFNTEI